MRSNMDTKLSLVVLLGLFLLIQDGAYAQEQELTYHVLEENTLSNFVGNPVIDSKLRTTLERMVNVQFSFVSPNNSQSRYFAIDKFTGEVITLKPLDREVLCLTNSDCPVDLDVAVQTLSAEPELIRILRVQVDVHDINDNAPSFPSSSVALPIVESTPIQTTFTVSAAADPDSAGNNSVISYELQPSDGFGMFGISVINNLWDGTTDIGVIVNQMLDRETTDFYQIQIIAKDGGSPQHTGTLTVDISVTDSNDHEPIFTKPIYNITIRENVVIGTEILRLTTEDRDIGINGEVSYKFNDRFADRVGTTFQIDEATGAVTIGSPVDYETSRVYQLGVEARDNGVPPKTSQAALIINVLDVNDNPPDITFNLLAGGDHALVSEYAKNGSFVAHLSIRDADLDVPQKISCSMQAVQSPEFALQQMSEKEFKIILTTKLDRETNSDYLLNITCEDNGIPSLQATDSLLVVVKDENDNSPVFQKTIYTASVKENVAVGASILGVSARDIDTGGNSKITYELAPGSLKNLTIHATTGVLSARDMLDREQTPVIELQVLARDSGSPRHTATATIVLTLEDENDVAPSFKQENYQFSVKENLGENQSLGSVSASDPDSGKGGEITYTLLETSAPEGVFAIAADTGVIEATKPLDREEQDKHTLVVMAADKGTPPQSSTAIVVIDITDVNDNYPVITYPTETNNTVVIPSWEADTFITKVEAFDKDIGKNGRLNFSIQDGETVSFLRMDINDGEIRLAKEISPIFAGTYQLGIIVKDSGIPAKSTRRILILVVTVNNGTISSSVTDTKTPNVAIVLSVVAVTVIVSAAIIIGILVIRRQDKVKGQTSATTEEKNILRRRSSSSTASKASQQSDLSTVSCIDELKKDVSFGLSEESRGSPDLSPMTSCYVFHPQPPFLSSQCGSPKPQVLNTGFTERSNTLYDPVANSQNKDPESPDGEFLQITRGLQNNNVAKQRTDSDNTSETLTNSDSGRGYSDEDLHDKIHMADLPESPEDDVPRGYYMAYCPPVAHKFGGPENSASDNILRLSSFRRPSPKDISKENPYYDMTLIKKSINIVQVHNTPENNSIDRGSSVLPPRIPDRGRHMSGGHNENGAGVSPVRKGSKSLKRNRPSSIHIPQNSITQRANSTNKGILRNTVSSNTQEFPAYSTSSVGGSRRLSPGQRRNWSPTDSRSYSIELEELGSSSNI